MGEANPGDRFIDGFPRTQREPQYPAFGQRKRQSYYFSKQGSHNQSIRRTHCCRK